MPTVENFLSELPDDKEALKAMLLSLWQERERQAKRADELYLENLQLQKELLRYKKATYGPRADRLTENELAQALLEQAKRFLIPMSPIQQKNGSLTVRSLGKFV